MQAKPATAHKSGPALYFEMHLPSPFYMFEVGGVVVGGWLFRDTSENYRQAVLQHRINSRELKEAQLQLTENIIYVFLKIESKNYINSNEV